MVLDVTVTVSNCCFVRLTISAPQIVRAYAPEQVPVRPGKPNHPQIV